jgi:hypothetical protein
MNRDRRAALRDRFGQSDIRGANHSDHHPALAIAYDDFVTSRIVVAGGRRRPEPGGDRLIHQRDDGHSARP